MINAMKNFLIIVSVILVAALGYYLFTNRGENQSFILSASFDCKDGFPFMAEFPDDNTVKITYNTTAAYNKTFVGTLPRTEGDGKRYENKDIAYVFAGEEATVITKADNKTVTCTQPFGANNAPVNFGDAGEGGGEKQDMALVVSESIVGRWQSTDDQKFIREFKKDSTVADIYAGKTLSTGSWKAYTKEDALPVFFPLEADAVYLRILLSNTQGDTQNFKLSKLTPESLELISMEKGNVLRFTSIQ